jgi:5-methyltetrahydrofolate--homocysteine methyltransferase
MEVFLSMSQSSSQGEKMDKSLVERLSVGETLIADGATGTMLFQAGLPAGTPPEAWNVERPEQVVALHRAYIEAGSQIILTNTFGGSRLKLDKSGWGERVAELNRAAAELARQAAAGEAYVAGDIGPTGELMSPYGSLMYATALEAFSEQAQALAQGGADFIWVETMMDLEEARAAVSAARQATTLPVICSLSFASKGRTLMGASARQAAETLWPLGLAAIGANCGKGLEVIEPALAQLRAVLPQAPLIAKPNAGLPKMVNEQAVYDLGPEEFAAQIAGFVDLGARIVGACCGSNPAFISAIRAALKQ